MSWTFFPPLTVTLRPDFCGSVYLLAIGNHALTMSSGTSALGWSGGGAVGRPSPRGRPPGRTAPPAGRGFGLSLTTVMVQFPAATPLTTYVPSLLIMPERGRL